MLKMKHNKNKLPSISTSGNIKGGIAFLVFPASFFISQHSTKEKQGNRTVLINHIVQQLRGPLFFGAFNSQRKDLKLHKNGVFFRFTSQMWPEVFLFIHKPCKINARFAVM